MMSAITDSLTALMSSLLPSHELITPVGTSISSKKNEAQQNPEIVRVQWLTRERSLSSVTKMVIGCCTRLGYRLNRGRV